MKSFICAVAFVLLVAVSQSECARCKRGIRSCNVTIADGSWELRDYDGCAQMCCGSTIHDRDSFLECCGTEKVGAPYNTETESCCAWHYGNEFSVNNKSQNAFCCGSEQFTRDVMGDQSCCQSYMDRPALFSSTTEMCCDGKVQFAQDTAYTSCCGGISFDRRVASCPCHDGQVFPAPQTNTSCCRGEAGAKAPFNNQIEGCCNGVAFDLSTQECCGKNVTDLATEVCCNDVIVPRDASQLGADVACCLLVDGSTFVFDAATKICCGGIVQDRTANTTEICCGSTVYDTATSGGSCCNEVPYSNLDSVCCGGNVSLGDSCCGDQAYSRDTQICCGGIVSDQAASFTNPSCCVNETFDAYTQTCCGSTIFSNPETVAVDGSIMVSHNTRCCGDFSIDTSLLVFDYMNSLCCNSQIVDLAGLEWDRATCCGNFVINTTGYTCCDGNPIDLWYGESTGCCNGSAINSTDTLCCDGIENKIVGNNTQCCGTTTMDPDVSKCCQGVPRALNGVPKEKAICCGEGCIDGTSFFCCDGKQYQKGNDVGVDVTGLTCDALFLP